MKFFVEQGSRMAFQIHGAAIDSLLSLNDDQTQEIDIDTFLLTHEDGGEDNGRQFQNEINESISDSFNAPMYILKQSLCLLFLLFSQISIR